MALTLAATLIPAAPVFAEPAASRSPRIVNGLVTHDYPAAGALLRGSDADDASTWCSGTLIGCETFLTAAHCVEDDTDPSHYWVYLQNVGVLPVASLSTHPDYTQASWPLADVAVLKLSA